MEVLGERGGRPVYENPSRQPVQHSFGVLMTRELRGDFGDPRRVPVDETAIARAAVELVQLQDQEHRPVGQVGPLPGGIHGRRVAVEMPCHRGREKVLQHRPLDPGVAKHEACRPRSPERVAQPAAALAPRRIQEHVNRVGPQGEPGCRVDPVELAIAAQKCPALEVGVLVPAQEHVVERERARPPHDHPEVAHAVRLEGLQAGSPVRAVQAHHAARRAPVRVDGAVIPDPVGVHQIHRSACGQRDLDTHEGAGQLAEIVRQGSAVLRGLDVKLDEPAIPTRARARRPAEQNLPVVPTFRDGVFRDLLPGSAERTPDRVCQREQTRAPNQADVGELHRALQELPVVGDLLHREPGRFPPPAERAGPPVEVSGIQVVDLHDGACVRERQDVRPLLLQADAGPGSIGRDMPVAVVAHRWQTDTLCRDRGGREGGGVVGDEYHGPGGDAADHHVGRPLALEER